MSADKCFKIGAIWWINASSKKRESIFGYRNIVEESDYWEVLELNEHSFGQWYFVADIENAKRFANKRDAQVFLTKNLGSFGGIGRLSSLDKTTFTFQDNILHISA